jgi:protein gp37
MAIARRHTFKILTKRPARMLTYLRDAECASRVLDMAGLEVMDMTDPLDRRRGDLRATFDDETWPLPNVWLGVSVENQRWADERIPLLVKTPAAVRFLSCEPLLGPLTLAGLGSQDCARCDGWAEGINDTGGNLCYACDGTGETNGIDWVIAGAESGKGARPMEHDWVRSLRDQCVASGKQFMWKQDATLNGRKISLPVLDGRTWTDMPDTKVQA